MFLDVSDFARAIFHDFKGVSLLSTVVKRINQGKNGVTAQTSDGKVVEAKAVISTLPLNCLQDMTFNPPLSPLRREAISSGHIDKGAKVHLSMAATEPGWFAICASKDSTWLFAFSDHNGTYSTASTGTWCIGFGYNFGYNRHLTDKTYGKHIMESFREIIRNNALKFRPISLMTGWMISLPMERGVAVDRINLIGMFRSCRLLVEGSSLAVRTGQMSGGAL